MENKCGLDRLRVNHEGRMNKLLFWDKIHSMHHQRCREEVFRRFSKLWNGADKMSPWRALLWTDETLHQSKRPGGEIWQRDIKRRMWKIVCESDRWRYFDSFSCTPCLPPNTIMQSRPIHCFRIIDWLVNWSRSEVQKETKQCLFIICFLWHFMAPI